MATAATDNPFSSRFEELRQQKEAGKQTNTLPTYSPKQLEKIELSTIIIRPKTPTWEELEEQLQDVTIIAKPLIWITIKKLFEQGYGAELLTAAEIARERHTTVKNPSHYFIRSISKASENWERTLQTVHDTWRVRQNAVTVIEKLALKADSTKAILKLAWKLRDRILSFLDIAMEQGTGIINPAGVFLALTRKPKPTAS